MLVTDLTKFGKSIMQSGTGFQKSSLMGKKKYIYLSLAHSRFKSFNPYITFIIKLFSDMLHW
jgi:hypothetical protein